MKYIDYLYTTCVNSNADFVNRQMKTAKEVSKKGMWANILLKIGDWSEFAIKKDYHTRIYKNKNYLIFVHSCIEYFYPIKYCS
jgi:hypothetical protein